MRREQRRIWQLPSVDERAASYRPTPRELDEAELHAALIATHRSEVAEAQALIDDLDSFGMGRTTPRTLSSAALLHPAEPAVDSLGTGRTTLRTVSAADLLHPAELAGWRASAGASGPSTPRRSASPQQPAPAGRQQVRLLESAPLVKQHAAKQRQTTLQCQNV